MGFGVDWKICEKWFELLDSFGEANLRKVQYVRAL
jgi:hypothetical protein